MLFSVPQTLLDEAETSVLSAILPRRVLIPLYSFPFCFLRVSVCIDVCISVYMRFSFFFLFTEFLPPSSASCLELFSSFLSRVHSCRHFHSLSLARALSLSLFLPLSITLFLSFVLNRFRLRTEVDRFLWE